MGQGYNARLDDSLGAKHGSKSQSEKSRRDESEGMEKSMHKRKFSGNKSSAQGGTGHTGHTPGQYDRPHILKHMNPDLAYMPIVTDEKSGAYIHK